MILRMRVTLKKKMRKIKNILNHNYLKSFIIFILVLATISGISLQSYQKLETPLLRADFISTLVPGIAYFKEMGSPYLDYWEIRPPALQFMTGLWGVLTGSSLQSFHILYLLFFTGIIGMSWIILGKLFSFFEKILIYSIFSLIFFTNSVQTQFFPPEINGLFFSLLGLVFALKKNPSKKDFFWSSFFFIIASQMKEVFAFTGLSLFPHLIVSMFSSKKKLQEFIISVFVGIVVAIGVVLSYLLFTQSLSAYGEVIQYKSQIFDPTNFGILLTRISSTLGYLVRRFLAIPYNVMLLFIVWIVLIFFWIKKNSLKIVSRKNQNIVQFIFPKELAGQLIFYFIAIFYWVGAFLGYLMQNRYNHIYDISILFSFVLILGLIAKSSAYCLVNLSPFNNLKKNNSFITGFSFLVIAFLLVPKKQIILENYYQLKSYRPKIHFSRWINAENPEYTKLESKIRNNTSYKSCINVQHGWNVGQQYYYTNRKPCTRFFITNILPQGKISEYQLQLTNNPPSAMIFFTELTDLNVSNFDKNIFNFTEVINECFIQDNEFSNLYWPASKGDEFKECFKTGLPKNPN